MKNSPTLFILLYLTLSHFMRLVNLKSDKVVYYTQKGDCVMKELKTKVSITLDTTVIEKIKEMAEADDRSFSQYINLILKEYLAQKDNKTNTPKA